MALDDSNDSTVVDIQFHIANPVPYPDIPTARIAVCAKRNPLGFAPMVTLQRGDGLVRLSFSDLIWCPKLKCAETYGNSGCGHATLSAMDRKWSVRERRLRRTRRGYADPELDGRISIWSVRREYYVLFTTAMTLTASLMLLIVFLREFIGAATAPECQVLGSELPAGPVPKFDGVAGRIDCDSIRQIGVEAMFRTAPYATDIVALTLIGAWIFTLTLSRITDTCELIVHFATLCWRWVHLRFTRS